MRSTVIVEAIEHPLRFFAQNFGRLKLKEAPEALNHRLALLGPGHPGKKAVIVRSRPAVLAIPVHVPFFLQAEKVLANPFSRHPRIAQGKLVVARFEPAWVKVNIRQEDAAVYVTALYG